MTSDRANAYRLVMHTLTELGPSKLLENEQQRIRDAADTLIFSPDPQEFSVSAAVADIEMLCDALVRSGRWERVTATRLADNVVACGPSAMVTSKAA